MDNRKTRIYYNKLHLFWILLFYLQRANSSDSTTSPTKDNCKCEWTPWMNSDNPNDNGNQVDDESYDSLRKKGYKFCEKPVEIRCFNIALNDNVTEAFGSTCDVDSGLRCSYFCDDYKIQVKCCYCPPDSAGPEFLIESQSSSGSCLSATIFSTNSTFAEVGLATTCSLDQPAQRWSWVSRDQLKNSLTQQCLAVTNDEVGSSIVTINCDEKDDNQEWGHDKHTNSLSHSISYIDSDTAVLTQSVSKSHWQGRVEIGPTYLDTFQEFPCKTSPLDPVHGSVSCSFGSYVGSECLFSCDYGYTLPPKAKYPIVCMKNQLFNGSDPVCERVICNPPITTHLNGNVKCSNENYQGSNCVFSCNEGYSLASNNKQSFCEENGEWDNFPAPTCNKITCGGDLEKQGIANGEVNCSNSNSYHSECTYSCSHGHELIGTSLRVCTEDTTWSDPKPICQKIECGMLDPIKNGDINCSNHNYFMSKCQYSCDVGYTVVGSSSTTCNADKEWGSPSPLCEKKTCSVLEVQEHGSMTCSDGNFFNSVCEFACDKAYKIEGESTLTCTALGWDYGSPSCIRIVCTPHFLNPISGNVQCTDDDYFDSTCHFTCQPGYEVKGSRAAQCMASGSWNATGTTCQKQLCPELLNPKNGQVVCNAGNEFNSICFYNCNEGFTKSDTDFLMCGANGQWSGPSQTCQRIKCRKLTFLRKGTVTCSDKNNYKSNCTFECNAGFNLYGAKETFCGTSGWDAQVPTCGRVLCTPPLARPADGQVKCSTRGALNCTFSCDKGFHLVGNSKTYCQTDETWSNTETPVCQKIECTGESRVIAHGSVDCTNGDYYGSQCTFTCNKGYTLEGDSVSQCTDQGTWDLSPPACQRISCPERNSLSNGAISCTDKSYYDSICTFSCMSGYVLIGVNSAKCFLNETWSERLPYCERITCSPSFSNPSNGRVTCSDANNFGSICAFHCEEGFSMEGESTTQCSADGWSIVKAPSCKKITCPEEKSVSVMYGSESCDRSNDFQSLCVYTCNTGYEVVGEFSRVCSKKGTWTSPKPTCSMVQCPALDKIENGETYCGGTTYNSVCVFLCDSGYVLLGKDKTICGADKAWNPLDLPVCNYVTTTTSTTTTIPVTNSTIKSTTTTTTTTSIPNTTIPDVTTTSQQNTTIMPPTNVVDSPVTAPATEKPTTLPDVITGNKHEGNTPSETIEPPGAAGVPMVPIIVGVVVALLVLVIVIVVVLWRKRNKHSKYGNGTTSRGLSKKNNRYDESEVMKLVPSNGSTNRRYPPVLIDRLESEFNRKHADDDKLFRDEFSHLPESSGSRQEGGKIQNKDKNRYTNITPYDHSRVVLPKSSNINESDYINASFIDGYKHKGKFIAAQGPKEATTNDFWRMIWDQNVTTIIMVTNLNEGKDSKCAQYWPSSGNSVFGNLRVVHTGENHLVDYTIRQFTVQQVREDATMSLRRNIMHYHFTSWPDFGVPKTPSGMLKFLRKIKHSSPTGYGAIVVHCSAGVGRTGTYICIDSMVDMMLRENKIDVYGFASQMRNQRPEMVQTEQQYIFIYQALLEHHLYGDTEVEASEVNAHIDELNQRMPGNVTGMEHEFKKLTTIRIQKEQMRAGNHPANMRKNRVLLILPYDWNRVILPVKRGVENSDYINASYIDGYRQKDAYIATQGPLAHTVEDFWRMIWETKSASIVMLTEVVERGQAKCEQYWPAEGTRIFGDISIEMTADDELDNYTTRDFAVTNINDPNSPKQIVKQFHYHGWPEVGPPVSGRSMIDLVEQVQKQQQSSGNHPITIHCSAGAGRTGAFCALSTALEQVKAEGVLDMFQIVKCLRMQRPHMVQNLEQYEFCYRAVQEYIDSMCEYYNFK